MSRDEIADFIKNEIQQTTDSDNTNNLDKEGTNKYDRFIERIFDKIVSKELGAPVSVELIKKITKAMYNFGFKLESWSVKNGWGPGQVFDYPELRQFVDNPSDLKKRYDLLYQIADQYPNNNIKTLACLKGLAMREENNAKNIQQVFAVCEKIMSNSPAMSENVEKSKLRIFQHFCANNPQQGLLATVDMLINRYPNQNDLLIGYSGIMSLLQSSKMKKELYPPLLKILKVCSKSGYNKGEAGAKFNEICLDLD
ncbi:MAG: hypothetical protein IJW75_05230, partial [Alphaproteobacteria bacterium]|nr:hypothetical protein [Alphaproteobacteria bacterium]